MAYVASPAQARVLEELARDGATNAEIAARLYLVEQTVKFHLHDVGRATGLHGRTAIALWWIRTGRYAQSQLEVLAA